MSVQLRAVPCGSVPARRGTEPPAGGVDLYWLGQAGFLLEARGLRILIDPYLSDVLAVKYAKAKYPHIRMMKPPVEPDQLFDIDFMLCSHGHTDHLDPGTIRPVAVNNPGCLFIVPGAVRRTALERGVPPDRLVEAAAGKPVEGLRGWPVHAIPSAHEQLQLNDRGEHLFLGYVMNFGGTVLYHSGDCIPYDGLPASLRPFGIDVVLLPVNGRDTERTSNGIVGNFSLPEAVALMREINAGYGVGHHFGMFDFNTIDRKQAQDYLANQRAYIDGRFVLADTAQKIELRT